MHSLLSVTAAGINHVCWWLLAHGGVTLSRRQGCCCCAKHWRFWNLQLHITSSSLKVTTSLRVLHIRPLICNISTKPIQLTRDGWEGWSSWHEELIGCSKELSPQKQGNVLKNKSRKQIVDFNFPKPAFLCQWKMLCFCHTVVLTIPPTACFPSLQICFCWRLWSLPQ